MANDDTPHGETNASTENATVLAQEQFAVSSSENTALMWWAPLAYLFGSQRAIHQLLHARGLHWLALALLLSASLARNYDGASIIHEPDVLLHGVVVSLGNSTVFFLLGAWLVRGRGIAAWGWAKAWWRFVLLFWMTSSMAWLYAIPYEQFLTPLGAIEANGTTLSIVSVWRVLLMARVMQVVFGARFVQALCVVLGFSTTAVFLAAWLSPQPLVDFMGGMRFTETERAMSSRHVSTLLGSLVLSPICLFAALIAIVYQKDQSQFSPPNHNRMRTPLAWWGPGVVALAALVGGLVWMQPSQQLRARAEAMLTSGDAHGAMVFMSAHNQADFPKLWEPPPRRMYRETKPSIEELWAALEKPGVAPWVRQVYLSKLWWLAGERLGWDRSRAMSLAPRDLLSLEGDSPSWVVSGEGSEPGTDQLATYVWWHLSHDETWTEEDRTVAKAWLAAKRKGVQRLR